jgi:hypothetical protein
MTFMGPTNVQNTKLFLVHFGMDSIFSSDGSIPKKLGVALLIIRRGDYRRAWGAAGSLSRLLEKPSAMSHSDTQQCSEIVCVLGGVRESVYILQNEILCEQFTILCKKELSDLYRLQCVVLMTELRRFRWDGYVAGVITK